MKKFLIVLVIAIVLAAVGFGAWGYLKAQEFKKQAQQIQQIIEETANLETVNQSDGEVSLNGWKTLSERSVGARTELEDISAISGELKEKVGRFYDAAAKDKYKEAQYLNLLLEGQSEMALKDTTAKSKVQIDNVLKAYDNLQTEITKNNLSLGPQFEVTLSEMEQEAPIFRSTVADLSSKMNSTSPSVQISSANFDKALDGLIQQIVRSLNDWVDLQNEIKNEVSQITKSNWVNPLSK